MKRVFFIPIIGLLLLSSSSFGQVTFTSQSISTQGDRKICVVDMNADYLDDIVTVSTSNIFVYYQNADSPDFTEGVFTTTPADFSPSWSMAAGDLTGNGYNDLLYGGGNGVTFMIANDDGTEYTETSGSEYVFSQRSNFVDINNDGNLDAFVCHDVAPNVYYINDGEGNLTFNQGGIGDYPTGGHYGSLWVDYNNDGNIDMFMAKCGGEIERRTNQLFENNGDGTFTNVAEDAGLADPVQTWSSAWGDFDNDGDMDVFVGASASSDTHKLMLNNGDGTFTDVTAGSGFDLFGGTSIEHATYDFNNDGYIDIFGNSNRIFINNGDMTFTETNAPFSGASIGDLNNDGFLDAFTGSAIYYNNGNANNWIVINTEGTESNRNGIGARVEVTTAMGTQIRDVRSGEGFRYMSTLNTHIGIGTDTEIESIVIKWPSGIVDEIENPAINTVHHIIEGENAMDINEQQLAFISLYPNPTNDQLHIASKAPVKGATATVYDVSGRMVLADVLQTNNLNVSALNTGVYFLNLDIADKKVKLQFIKQ